MSDKFYTIDFSENTVKKIETCKGRIYRGYVSQFVSEGRIVERRELRLLKRKSCHGCAKCGYLEEDLKEDIACSAPDLARIKLDTIENKKLYTLYTVIDNKDWETGQVDDWHIELIEWKEPI
jgi:hypothetical protein